MTHRLPLSDLADGGPQSGEVLRGQWHLPVLRELAFLRLGSDLIQPLQVERDPMLRPLRDLERVQLRPVGADEPDDPPLVVVAVQLGVAAV
jgi:hypothetical protein